MENQYYKYLTHSDNDKNWGLYLNVAGFSFVPPNSNYPITKHPDDYHFNWEKGRVLNEFVIMYITKGNGILETKDSSIKIQAGTIFIIRTRMWHRYKPNSKTGWNEYYVGFPVILQIIFLTKIFLQIKILFLNSIIAKKFSANICK